jgi:hypothetical protein
LEGPHKDKKPKHNGNAAKNSTLQNFKFHVAAALVWVAFCFSQARAIQKFLFFETPFLH